MAIRRNEWVEYISHIHTQVVKGNDKEILGNDKNEDK